MDAFSAISGALGTFVGDFLYALFLYLLNIALNFSGGLFPMNG
jgi:hypothetical protein